MQGYHSGSFLVSLLGIFKAVVGILIRPTVGICEFGGKSAYGIGLLFLGREGISGTIQKRVRAPGTLTDDSEEVSTIGLRTKFRACERLHFSSVPWAKCRAFKSVASPCMRPCTVWHPGEALTVCFEQHR